MIPISRDLQSQYTINGYHKEYKKVNTGGRYSSHYKEVFLGYCYEFNEDPWLTTSQCLFLSIPDKKYVTYHYRYGLLGLRLYEYDEQTNEKLP